MYVSRIGNVSKMYAKYEQILKISNWIRFLIKLSFKISSISDTTHGRCGTIKEIIENDTSFAEKGLTLSGFWRLSGLCMVVCIICFTRKYMERIAIIDLGSNSVRFIIMQVAGTGAYKLIYQEKKSIRLSEGMTKDDMMLTEEAQRRALDCLRVYAHAARVLHVTRTLAVATAAVRNARNGASFLKRVRTLTSIPMTIISGREEARLGFSGVIHTIDENDFLLFDLGGASVEISLVRAKKRLHSISIPMGAVTLTEMFNSSDTVTNAQKERMASFIRKKLQEVSWLPKGPIPIIGIGGTVRNLAKIHQRRIQYPLPKLHNYQFPAADLFPLVDEICSKNCAERRRISGLSSERADIIIAGALVVSELVRLTNAKSLTISGCGIREGLFFHYYDPLHGAHHDWEKHMLLSSVRNYRKTLPLDDTSHTKYVTAMALTLFDSWKKMHGLSERDRLLLATASLLHDIGSLINYYSHARHSAYMIANAHLFGLTHKEQLMCALIAAFHHGYSGKILKTNPLTDLLTEEDLQKVKKLSLFLALAEGLDETKEQCITRLVCHSSPRAAELRVYINQDAFDVQAHAIQPFIRPFEKLFRRPLDIQWFPGSHQASVFKKAQPIL